MEQESYKIYKIVLTGGPCGGKTTSLARLSSFFENIGWKVYQVPEAATILMGGGVEYSQLTSNEKMIFQKNLLMTIMSIERTFSDIAKSMKANCLIICDRGVMDVSAYIESDVWERIKKSNGWNEIDLRDNRYNHVVHMMSAAIGAAEFYSTKDHTCRSEDVEQAREIDAKLASAWNGHPYFDFIDNSTGFDAKVDRVIERVCQKLGIDTGDRFSWSSRKLKFLVSGSLCSDNLFPPFQEFYVFNYYLKSTRDVHCRLRKRGSNGHWSYILITSHPNCHGQSIELKKQLTSRDYFNMLSMKDNAHFAILTKRRCFLVNNQYFQMDIFQEPCHPRCRGLILLETYTSLEGEQLKIILPSFINNLTNVTGDSNFTMFNLSKKDDDVNS